MLPGLRVEVIGIQNNNHHTDGSQHHIDQPHPPYMMEFDLTFSYQRQKKRGRKDYIHPPVVEPQLIISCDTQTGSNGPDIRKGKFIAPKQIYKVIDKRQTQQKQMADGAAQRHIIRKQLDKQVHRQGTQHIEEQHEIVCS